MEKWEKDILAILSADARKTPKDISVMLGISEQDAEKKIKNLEDRGIIVGYMAIVNTDTVEDDTVEALIEVKVTPQRGQGFDRIADEIASQPEVQNLYLMSGVYDLAVFVKGKSLKSVSRFVSERISTYDSVISTATHFILKRYKVEGAVLKPEEESVRLSVQP